ncbi:MAG: hypothetical protein LBP59_05080 [Planctomycetaceae bacterium]|nr:hypothetical protein [Planctomycetaceae bacterium]
MFIKITFWQFLRDKWNWRDKWDNFFITKLRRNACVSPAFQDRGRLACKRLYSTANERGLHLNRR